MTYFSAPHLIRIKQAKTSNSQLLQTCVTWAFKWLVTSLFPPTVISLSTVILYADGCDDYVCQRPGSLCMVDGFNNPTCDCPKDCDDQPTDYVCGQITGEKAQTYKNLCSLQYASCMNDAPHTVIYGKACTGKPMLIKLVLRSQCWWSLYR